MRAKKLASAATALALLLNTSGAAAFDPFIEQDEIVMHFEGKTPGKLENLRLDTNGVKLAARRALLAQSVALLMFANAANAFGVSLLPFRGVGEFEFAMTLGFLSSIGLSPSSLVALEVDIPFNSIPLSFFVLAARPFGDDLRVSVSSQGGAIGSPVTLEDTRLAQLRISQTASQLIFDTRNARGGSWLNVATLANPVSADVFQLSFGAAFLNPGAVAFFDDLEASGDIFGLAETTYLASLYDLIDDLGIARDAVVHETDGASALATLAAFQNALLLAAAGISADVALGQFLAFTQVALALKHLKAADRESSKAVKALGRGDGLGGIERITRTVAFVQLASLAMRGINARKIEDLLFFQTGVFDKAMLAETVATQ